QLDVNIFEMNHIATDLVPRAVQEFTSVADTLFASSQLVQARRLHCRLTLNCLWMPPAPQRRVSLMR
ncbi:MAG: hypothetical protein ACKVON_10790, partial [Beijerinckiaceae bacterium]